MEEGPIKNKLAYSKLPEEYRLTKEFDLSENLTAKILLSLISLVLFFLFLAVFIWLLQVLRPGGFDFDDIFSFYSDVRFFPDQILILLLITFGMAFLHEGIHGLFFWLFTKEKPKFGFKLVYAYAGAPGWYITKWPYLVIGISPFIMITVIGFVTLLNVPMKWILPILFFITINASGAAGDIYTVFWLLPQPSNILVHDSGEKVKIFEV
jgi:hypothetical protein